MDESFREKKIVKSSKNTKSKRLTKIDQNQSKKKINLTDVFIPGCRRRGRRPWTGGGPGRFWTAAEAGQEARTHPLNTQEL